MKVRRAEMADMMGLLDLGREMHARSCYAGRATLDERMFRNICVEARRLHGENCCIFVATDGEDKPAGLIIGVLDRLYAIAKEKCATDLFFYVRPGTHWSAMTGLMNSFIRWAKSRPDAIEIRIATSDAIAGADHERLGRYYRRLGMKPCGNVYRMEIAA